MKKRVLSILTLCVFLLTLLPVSAFATGSINLTSPSSGGTYYRGSTVTVSGTVPSSWNGQSLILQVIRPNSGPLLFVDSVLIGSSSFTKSFDLPSNAETGSYTINAILGSEKATGSFTVSSDAITLNSPAGGTYYRGSTVTFSGTVPPSWNGQSLILQVIRPNSGPLLFVDSVLITGGGFSGSFTLPGDADYGAYTVNAILGSVKATNSFNVTTSGGGGGTTPTVQSISVSPTSVTLAPGGTQNLTVTANMSDGTTPNVTTSASYASSNAAVASVTGSTLTVASTAKDGDTATITASYSGRTATCVVTVRDPKLVTSLAFDPTNLTLAPGATQQLSLKATLADNTQQAVADKATYQSSNPAVATVSASGVLSVSAAAKTGDTATLTASYSGKTATCAITVNDAKAVTGLAFDPSSLTLAPGATQQLSLKATLADNTQQAVADKATYQSSNPAVATVSASGVLSVAAAAKTGDTATLTASYSGKTATCLVTINDPKTVTGIVVAPKNVSLAPGATKVLTVKASLADGTQQVVTDQAVYQSSDPQIVSVSKDGSITAAADAEDGATATITVSYSDKKDTVTVTIEGIKKLLVEPQQLTLAPGTAKALTVTALFAGDVKKDVTRDAGITYKSNAQDVVTVSEEGVVSASDTARNGAKAMITVAKGGKTATVAVLIKGIKGLEAVPKTLNLVPGTQGQLQINAILADGSKLDFTQDEDTTYESNNPKIAEVDEHGLVSVPDTAKKNAKATITVKSHSKTVKVDVVVQAIKSIEATPKTLTLVSGADSTLNVKALLSGGSKLDITNAEGITYESSDPAVAEVSEIGLVHIADDAEDGAKATITVKYDDYTAKCAITVKAVKSIAVTPKDLTLTPGENKQLVVTAKLSGGTSLDITKEAETTYESSAPEVVQVNASGLLTVAMGAAHADSAVITVKYGDKTATIKVSVNKIKSLKANPSEVILLGDKDEQLHVIAMLVDGNEEDLTDNPATTYKSSSKLISVSSTGLVSAAANAKDGSSATITIQNSGKTAIVKATLKSITKLQLTPSNLTLESNKIVNLKAEAILSGGKKLDVTNNEEIIYKSSAPKVVEVSPTGELTVVKGAKNGARATITAKLGDKTATSSVTVKIVPEVVELQLTPTTLSLKPNSSRNFQVTAVLDNGKKEKVTNKAKLTSSDPSIATVSQSGIVKIKPKAKSGSTVTINIEYQGQSATLEVTVK